MDAEFTKKFVSDAWDSSIIPTLSEYIRIPNSSPSIYIYILHFI
jgi:hypothetical protein